MVKYCVQRHPNLGDRAIPTDPPRPTRRPRATRLYGSWHDPRRPTPSPAGAAPAALEAIR